MVKTETGKQEEKTAASLEESLNDLRNSMYDVQSLHRVLSLALDQADDSKTWASLDHNCIRRVVDVANNTLQTIIDAADDISVQLRHVDR